MATLTVKAISLTALDIDPAGANYQAASAGGDQVAYPEGGSLYLALDSGATAADVTLNSQHNCDQGFDHDLTTSLGANQTKIIKVPPRFKDSSGYVQISYTAVTDIKVLALRG